MANRAHAAVRRALKAGILTRQPCEVCGATGRIDAHHDDYGQPLAVHWFCIPHHWAHHKSIRLYQATLNFSKSEGGES